MIPVRFALSITLAVYHATVRCWPVEQPTVARISRNTKAVGKCLYEARLLSCKILPRQKIVCKRKTVIYIWELSGDVRRSPRALGMKELYSQGKKHLDESLECKENHGFDIPECLENPNGNESRACLPA